MTECGLWGEFLKKEVVKDEMVRNVVWDPAPFNDYSILGQPLSDTGKG